MNNGHYCIKQIGFIPPPYGGVSVYVRRLIEHLNQDGYITGGYYLSQNEDLKIKFSPLFHQWAWLNTSAFFQRIISLSREVAPYRIVHSHFSLEGMVFLWTLKKFLRKKIIVTVHHSMSVSYFRQTNIINKIFLRLLANSDVQWIAVSQQAKEEMLKLPLNFKMGIEVIPAYIPSNTCAQDKLSPTMDLYIKQHDKTIVFYGHSFMMHNGTDVYGFYDALDMYVKIIKKNISIGLIYCIADQSDQTNIERVKCYADKFGVGTMIYWQIGAIANMQTLWGKVDVYVRPTSTDGDSVAVREALDAGVHVVASDVCVRPITTLIYSHNNHIDFVDKVIIALQQAKSDPIPNNIYYEQMVAVYKNILHKNNQNLNEQ